MTCQVKWVVNLRWRETSAVCGGSWTAADKESASRHWSNSVSITQEHSDFSVESCWQDCKKWWLPVSGVLPLPPSLPWSVLSSSLPLNFCVQMVKTVSPPLQQTQSSSYRIGPLEADSEIDNSHTEKGTVLLRETHVKTSLLLSLFLFIYTFLLLCLMLLYSCSSSSQGRHTRRERSCNNNICL